MNEGAASDAVARCLLLVVFSLTSSFKFKNHRISNLSTVVGSTVPLTVVDECTQTHQHATNKQTNKQDTLCLHGP
jgi:hypothetical protein